MSRLDAIRRPLVRSAVPILTAISVVCVAAVTLGYPSAAVLWTLVAIPAVTAVGLVLVVPQDRATWTAAGVVATVLTVSALQLLQPRPGGWVEVCLLLGTAAVGLVGVGRVITRLLESMESQEAELCRLQGHAQRTEEHLAQAEEQSRCAQHAKDTFLANMSHELRTPLNAVMGYTELAIEELGQQEHPEALRDLHRVESAARHLLGLIASILELTQIDVDLEVEVSLIDPAVVVVDALAVVRPELERGANELVVEGDDPGTFLVGTDLSRLRQIAVNLLSNAAKFTDRGRIVVRWSVEDADADGRVLCIEVEDSGPGIPKESLKRIFERFEQLDPSSTRTRGGAGLGLAVTQRLVAQLDGELTVESEQGVGTTFHVRLPDLGN